MTNPQESEALRASHKAMLEALVQIVEEIMYPIDELIPSLEATIFTAEQLREGDAAMRPNLLPWFTLDRRGDCITLTLRERKTLNLTPLMARELMEALTLLLSKETLNA